MKTLIQSKTFWLQILIFIGTAVEGFTKVKIDPVTLQQIVDLDWSHIGVAILSAITILVRMYFTSVPINGVITKGGKASDSFDVAKILIFVLMCTFAMTSCAKTQYGCTVPCNDALKTVRYGFLAYTNEKGTTFTKIIFDSTYVQEADKNWSVFRSGMTITKKE